jgi:hypothetical protein
MGRTVGIGARRRGAISQILAGVLPVLVAAVAYPVGNKLLNRAKHAGDEAAAMLAYPMAAVLLLSLSALPVFAALILVTMPPPPSQRQIAATAVIALIAGCSATTLFLYARNLSNDPFRIAAVRMNRSMTLNAPQNLPKRCRSRRAWPTPATAPRRSPISWFT